MASETAVRQSGSRRPPQGATSKVTAPVPAAKRGGHRGVEHRHVGDAVKTERGSQRFCANGEHGAQAGGRPRRRASALPAGQVATCARCRCRLIWIGRGAVAQMAFEKRLGDKMAGEPGQHHDVVSTSSSWGVVAAIGSSAVLSAARRPA